MKNTKTSGLSGAAPRESCKDSDSDIPRQQFFVRRVVGVGGAWDSRQAVRIVDVENGLLTAAPF